MYHEMHGEGEPLVLLHGAFRNIDGMAPLLGPLAEYRRAIAPELQGHGRTPAADRPLTYEGMADDTAALLDEPGVERADVVGSSMGAGVGLQLAIRHPDRIRRLVAASTTYAYDGLPKSRLASLPGTSHYLPPGSGALDRAGLMRATIRPFLEAE